MAEKVKTVFILGAGASRQAGAPLMADFLDVAKRLYRTGKTDMFEKDFATVFDALGDMQVIHSKSQLDTTNIEAVFSAFEFAQVINSFCGYAKERIPGLAEAAKSLIAKTIEETLLFPIVGTSLGPPEPYGRFAALLMWMKNELRPAHDVAIISFNYDFGADIALHRAVPQSPDYGLDGRRSHADAVPLLKLHGSVNWATCSVCKRIVPMTFDAFMRDRRYAPEDKFGKAEFTRRLTELKHCNAQVDSQPVLVPPTWNKSGYHEMLSTVWSTAARELSTADNIIVIGYSLAETDIFFRYLYALGTVGKRPLERFWLYDPDLSGNVRDRFHALLGSGAAQRFEYQQMTFENSIPYLQARLS
jgi:NAD-dependent SIR2 family protein deacetylase